jgi:hypothetical protein
MREDTRSLWEQYDSEVEPWRSGRLFLIFFAALSAVSDLLVCATFISRGLIEPLLVFAALRVLFWLQFYFVWIGVHWVRWLQAALNMFQGFAVFVRSLQGESGAIMVFGIFMMGTGAYLAFGPPVYFFAKRQQEKRNWLESLMVAAVFVLLLSSLTAGILGLFQYKVRTQEDARNFTDTAFARIFADHDTYFFLDHVTARMLAPPYGRGYLTKFLQDATIFAGDVQNIRKANGSILLRFAFPFTLFSDGEMGTEGIGTRGRVLLRLRVVGNAGDWKIDNVGWWYPEVKQAGRAKR